LGRQFGKEERKKATLANSAKSNSESKEVLKSRKKENKKLSVIQMENENIYILKQQRLDKPRDCCQMSHTLNASLRFSRKKLPQSKEVKVPLKNSHCNYVTLS